MHGARIKAGVTLPLGGLALQDISAKSIKKAEKIVRQALAEVPALAAGEGRTFYAVGGTWRALARLHMWQTGYPLHVMHGYRIPAREAGEITSGAQWKPTSRRSSYKSFGFGSRQPATSVRANAWSLPIHPWSSTSPGG